MMSEPTTTSMRQDQSARPGVGTMLAPQSGRRSWLICRAGRLLCALPIEHVLEIMRVLPVNPLAGAPDYVRGLCIVRGSPVPVVDAGLVIGNEATEPTRLVAIKAAHRIIALAVAEVVGITTTANDAADELPPLIRDAASETITAIGARDAELLVFLKSGRLAPDDVLARIEGTGAAP
jgi:purine-binding chemotaxis protein CheW